MTASRVLVIGGGIAGLCAAISARRAGADVLMVGNAPPWRRGGNSRHARNFRFCHDRPSSTTPGCYPADEFARDLERAAGASNDPALRARLIDESRSTPDWLRRAGVALQTRSTGRLPFSRKTAFLLGGGQAMVNALYACADRLGVKIRDWCAARHPRLCADRIISIELHPLDPGPEAGLPARCPRSERVAPDAVILASSGTQGNLRWLRAQLGERATGFINRGTPDADGELMLDLLAAGVQDIGDPRQLYLVAVDARSPPADGGIVTRIRGMPEGIVVDRDGRRHHDEGAERSSTRYALWGQRLADFPGQIGYLLLDAEGLARAPAALYPPIAAPDLPALARQLGIPADALTRTLLAYNAAARDPIATNHAALDTPPFAAYPMRPGLTFTQHGLAVDSSARVRMRAGTQIVNLFAAGSLMAPNICPQGYLSGLMLTIGVVFGRIAGAEAARHART